MAANSFTRARASAHPWPRWLLWLALLLPLAQGLALSHGYSHAAAPAVAEAGHAPHTQASTDGANCGLCLAAAHLGAGALPAAAGATVGPAVGAEVPLAAVPADWQASLITGYRSRAPPFAFC